MPKPHEGFMPPGFPGQTKILFVNEGNRVALLQTNKADDRHTGHMQIASAEAALAWCRENGAMMVYCPTNLSHG